MRRHVASKEMALSDVGLTWSISAEMRAADTTSTAQPIRSSAAMRSKSLERFSSVSCFESSISFCDASMASSSAMDQ